MFKKTVVGSLFAGSCVVIGHCYYNKNNKCSLVNEENIKNMNFLSDNVKNKLINLINK